jgi:hypothetical protein
MSKSRRQEIMNRARAALEYMRNLANPVKTMYNKDEVVRVRVESRCSKRKW